MNRLLVFILCIQFSYSQAQEPWLYENDYALGKHLIETYDGGTVILAIVEWQFGISKLFKLDAAGEIVWEHTLDDGTDYLSPEDMVEDSNGNIIIGGATLKYTSDPSAFVMKLNACGEELWLNEYSVPNQIGYTNTVDIDEEGNIYALQNISSDEGRFTFRKIDSDGDLLWTKQHLLDYGANSTGFISCSDGGFILQGDAYAPPYYDQSHPSGYLRFVTVKIDSLGEEMWQNYYRWEDDSQDTIYMSTGGGVIELANDRVNIVGVNANSSLYPILMYELNNEGELQWHKSIAKADTAYSNTYTALVSDSTILVGTHVAEPIDLYGPRHAEVYKLDLEGNKLDEWIGDEQTKIIQGFIMNKERSRLLVNIVRYPGGLYALKLNPFTMELDTFALEDNTEYDYYCPEGVTDQYINFPNLAVEDIFVQEKQQLRIAPNPAKNDTYIYFDIANFNRSAKIEIHNMQGQIITSQPILASNGRLYEDLSPYTSGIYVVSLIMDNRLLESSKLVVE